MRQRRRKGVRAAVDVIVEVQSECEGIVGRSRKLWLGAQCTAGDARSRRRRFAQVFIQNPRDGLARCSRAGS